jgi:ribosomal protein L37E
MPTTTPVLCARCRQTLAEGSNYCVACGFTNIDAMMGRRVAVEQQADERIERFKLLGSLLRFGGLLRFFK